MRATGPVRVGSNLDIHEYMKLKIIIVDIESSVD